MRQEEVPARSHQTPDPASRIPDPRSPISDPTWLRRLADLALVGALVVAVATPSLNALAAAALIGVVALCTPRPPRERVALALALMVGPGVLLVLAWQANRHDPAAELERAWPELLDELETTAAEVAAALSIPASEGEVERLATFEELALHTRVARRRGVSFLLVDRNGEAWAWAGEGLLHEPRPAELPSRGLVGWSGWSAATIAAVAPLDLHRRPWRLVAGRSLATDRFEPAALVGLRWRILTPEGVATADARRIEGGADRLDMLVELGEAPRAVPSSTLWLVAPLLVALGACVGRWHREHSWFDLVVLGVVAGGVALALGSELELALALAIVVAVAVLVATAPTSKALRPRVSALVLGALGSSVLLASLVWLHRRSLADDPLEAGGLLDPVLVDEIGWLVVAALAMLVLQLMSSAARGSTVFGPGRWGALAALLGLVAATTTAWPAVAATLLVGSSAALAAWGAGTSRFEVSDSGQGASGFATRAGVLLTLALASVALAASAWEVGRVVALDHHAESWAELLRGPSDESLDLLEDQLDLAFARIDLEDISPFTGSGELLPSDLAASVWRASPLRGQLGLSALAVWPAGQDPLTFSVGLPLAAGSLDPDPQRWRDLEVPGRNELLLAGEGEVWRGGEPWGSLRWWLLPSPGPGAQLVPRDPRPALWRGAGGVKGWMARVPAPLVVALLRSDGRAVFSPWREVPAAREGLVHTPDGRARAVARPWRDESEMVVFAPRPRPFGSLERVVTLSLAVSLLVGLLAAIVAVGLGLPRRLLLVVAELWRSYPRRLALVFGLLLLVPLVLLHLVFAQVLAERLRSEQRAAGETALRAAERVLGEYVESLPPGFSLATEIDDAFLVWLSRAVQHDLNLYWGSQLVASSKRELIDAGLLPERIPGDVYLRLALRGGELAARTRRTGGSPYRELYTPVAILGLPVVSSGLFLALPLLDVELAVERKLAELRRQSLTVVVLLFLALLALGLRLSKGFTRPIAEMVEGTRRIAAGASALGLTPPRERELAELAQAIDDMARRIAEGRERLVRGKQVVDRVIDHVTAGVVSLDREGRVVLLNRLATELLGVSPGVDLGRQLRSESRLAALACFLEDSRGGPLLERTVKIPDSEGEREWRAVWAPLPSGSSDDPTGLLVVEDATEALRAERLGAWAEMARMIAHEIKNPLTPIRLSAEHLREVWHRNPEEVGAVLERCVANILRQVEELRVIAAEFSTYAHIPRLHRQPADLRELAAELVEAYAAATSAPVAVSLVAPEGSIPVEIDRRLLGRALRNLLENAVRASPAGATVDVVILEEDLVVTLEVRDRGPGVPEALLGKIFDPYFSTHDSGTGLGLPIARRIVEEHGGELRAANRAGGGLVVTCTIPRR